MTLNTKKLPAIGTYNFGKLSLKVAVAHYYDGPADWYIIGYMRGKGNKNTLVGYHAKYGTDNLELQTFTVADLANATEDVNFTPQIIDPILEHKRHL
jgi:hypothetical protein